MQLDEAASEHQLCLLGTIALHVPQYAGGARASDDENLPTTDVRLPLG